MATHSSIPVWRIPWTEKPCGPQSTGSQRVRHEWSDLANLTVKHYIYSVLQGDWILTHNFFSYSLISILPIYLWFWCSQHLTHLISNWVTFIHSRYIQELFMWAHFQCHCSRCCKQIKKKKKRLPSSLHLRSSQLIGINVWIHIKWIYNLI